MFYYMRHIVSRLSKENRIRLVIIPVIMALISIIMVISVQTSYADDATDQSSSSNNYGIDHNKSEFENRRDARTNEQNTTVTNSHNGMSDQMKSGITTGGIMILLFFIVAGVLQTSNNREMRKEFDDLEKRLNESVREDEVPHDEHMDKVFNRLKEKHRSLEPVIVDSPLVDKTSNDKVSDVDDGPSGTDSDDSIVEYDDSSGAVEIATGDGDDNESAPDSTNSENEDNEEVDKKSQVD